MNDITFVGKHPLISSVSRHMHNTWEFVYCTHGSGVFHFDGRSMSYRKGDVAVIPPLMPHSNSSEDGMRNIYVNMQSPAIALKEPTVITDDADQLMLHAFQAAYCHFVSDRKERASFLSAYGSLICSYLTAYQTSHVRPGVVEEIEQAILTGYPNPDFELDAFLRALPFSYDYLRKLFQKEMGVTPHRYLCDKRLQAAAQLLSGGVDSGISIADVARMCGYREPLYFSRMFKKKFGISPSFYLEEPALSEASSRD